MPQNQQKSISICYIPGRETNYSRNRVLINSMKEAGIEVYDCSFPYKNFIRYILSITKFILRKNKCDIIFVGFLGQFIVPIVKIFTKKKIVFDAFISIYQTLVFDRKSINSKGILAKLSRFIDSHSCKLSDHVFLDTEQHINFFVNEYELDKNKFSKLLVGSDDSIMFPQENLKSKEFIVHFHGEFQAIHGAEYIIETAKLLTNIKFEMIGSGKRFNKCVTKAKGESITNINFIPTVEYEKLPEYMTRASICLGIFGNTQKTQLVIPHKVYEALAMKKPVITANTPAAKELLINEENAFLCKPANPQSLADAITKLKEDETLRNKIAENGYKTFIEKCSPKVLGEKILKISWNLLKYN